MDSAARAPPQEPGALPSRWHGVRDQKKTPACWPGGKESTNDVDKD